MPPIWAPESSYSLLLTYYSYHHNANICHHAITTWMKYTEKCRYWRNNFLPLLSSKREKIHTVMEFDIISVGNESIATVTYLYTHSYHFYALNYVFRWNEDPVLTKISQAISRTTGPNIGMFVLILMHFLCWFQIWSQNMKILKFWKKFKMKVHGFDNCM